jgi:D-alanyl-D-alanine carboxypeptidase/D-alanyl-D-alanine-endopeptidase (penicillin-binding protein 4)
VRRVPASNQKLLLTMALFEEFSPKARIKTIAAATSPPVAGVVAGNIYILGRGDPSVGNHGRFTKSLPFRATHMSRLARAVGRAGVTRVRGRVIGSTNYFARDWYAPGWKSFFPSDEIPLPTALTFEGNTRRGRHIDNPEYHAALALTRALERRGISVTRRPRAGTPSSSLTRIATVRSERLQALARFMNRKSANFFAEVLGKRLGVGAYGRPGTIAKGAAAIAAWSALHNVEVRARDSSGLSYDNRISPKGMARLLEAASAETWVDELRSGLPRGGQGTLEDRLRGVPVRAKTGTLDYISALSGWVWLARRDAWAEFSIMSSGLCKCTAAQIEDRIVRILHRYGR